MATASLSAARRQQLQAESIRRCNSWPSQSYVLAVLADRNGQATFSASYGDLVQACQQLQQQGWLAVTGTHQNLMGQQVVCCTAA